jgi:hypothetical protein
LEGVAFAVAFFVGVALFVAFAAADGVAEGVAEGVPTSVVGIVDPPPMPTADSVEVKVGGVILSTAPRLPTVPPAINSALFISLPSPINL